MAIQWEQMEAQKELAKAEAAKTNAEAAKLITTDTENVESDTEKNKQEIEESKKRIEHLTSQIHKTNEESKGLEFNNYSFTSCIYLNQLLTKLSSQSLILTSLDSHFSRS